MTSEKISLQHIVLVSSIEILQIITHQVQNSISKVIGSILLSSSTVPRTVFGRSRTVFGSSRTAREWQSSNWTVKASLTRHGRSGAPHYSLYSRTQSAKAFNTPGPGTYRNEKVTVVHKGAPKYSLSSRAKSGGTSKTPGKIENNKIIITINMKKL